MQLSYIQGNMLFFLGIAFGLTIAWIRYKKIRAEVERELCQSCLYREVKENEERVDTRT